MSRIVEVETFCAEGLALVRVRTEDGHEGWGQAAPYHADITALVLHRQVAPHALGQDDGDLTALGERVIEREHKFPGSHLVRALGGVDTALWDLRGRRAGRPVCELIGGSVRRLPVYASSMRRDIEPAEEAARLAGLQDRHGYRAVKFRIGRECGHDQDEWPGRTEAIVPAVRAAVAEGTTLLVDANSCYTPATAIEVGRMLQDEGVRHFEEPCPYWEQEWTAEVAAALDLDVTGGEQDCLLTTWRRMLGLRAVDVAQPDVCYLGGLTVLGGVGHKLFIDEVDLAPPRDGEVLVKVAASGLCASDLNAIDGKRTLAPFPLVPGHEAAGVVAQTGPGVARLQAGDAVVASIVPSCGDCPACARGRRNYCQTAGRAMSRGGLLDGSLRLSRNGEPLHHFLTVSSFAQYAVVPESGAVAIDARMPLDRAALISCAVLTGVGAVRNTARVRPGTRVAVFGCGGIGLNVVQGARLAGAARIVAVDLTEEKLDRARRFGATDIVHAGQEDPPGAIRRLTGGVDYAFEAAGREQTVQQAWSSLDVGGEAVVVGLMPHQATVTLSAGPFVNEQVIRGCYFGSADLRRDVPALVGDYLSGNLLLDELITRRIGLEELNDAFDALRAGKGARSVLVLD